MKFDYVFAEDPEIFEETEKIRVVLCEPGECARETQIGNSLEELQKAVDGYIEVYYGLDDPGLLIICNEEGKLKGMEPCRGIHDQNDKLIEVICGPFFICRDTEDGDFASLSDEDVKKCLDEFYRPEALIVSNNYIAMVPYEKDLGDELEI